MHGACKHLGHSATDSQCRQFRSSVHTTSDVDNSVAGAVWRRPVREAVCGVPYRAPLGRSSLGGPYRAVRRTPGATCGVAVWGFAGRSGDLAGLPHRRVQSRRATPDDPGCGPGRVQIWRVTSSAGAGETIAPVYRECPGLRITWAALEGMPRIPVARPGLGTGTSALLRSRAARLRGCAMRSRCCSGPARSGRSCRSQPGPGM
jgi:hypothetical protein